MEPDFASFGQTQTTPTPQPVGESPTRPLRSPSSAIASALAKAQAEFVQPKKTRTVTVKPRDKTPYSFNYADYSDIVEAVRGPLSRHGLAFTHSLEFRIGKLLLVTRLIHGDSGQELESVWPMTSSDDPKEVGGDMTYGKRYSLSAITGCVADEDLDVDPKNTTGYADRKAPVYDSRNDLPDPKAKAPAQGGAKAKISVKTGGAQAPAEPDLVTEAQLARLFTIRETTKWTIDQLRMYMEQKYRVGSSKMLTRGQYDELVDTIQTKEYGPAFAASLSFGAKV